jgi:hypothetical protein
MAKGITFDGQLLALIFNGTSITGLAQNIVSSPLTTLYVSLHTADPTSSGNQSSNETSYGGYTRIGVARSTGGWTVSTNSVSPASNINFPAGTSGSQTITNWAIGTLSSGAGQILWTGTVSPNISVGTGITPILTSASSVVET